MSVSASYAYAAPKTLVKQAVECHNMLFEERLEAAERRRRDGNALFQDGQYTEALGKYAMALSFVDEDFMMQLEGPHLQKAEAVIMPIHLNMAAVQIKLEDYQTAVWNCTQVLQHDPDNAKGLFRRGKARHALGHTDEALKDLEAAANKAAGDKGILRELQALKQTMKEEKKASAQMFRGALGPPPTPVQRQSSSSNRLSQNRAGNSSPGSFLVDFLNWLTHSIQSCFGLLLHGVRTVMRPPHAQQQSR
eukprot:jgi/Chrzof1/5443/Cz16g03080.t1